MSPGQVWWVIRAKMPKEALKRKDTQADLYRLLKEAKAKNGQSSR
jgi:DNA anti-recombination protein RmuC